jgi:hypothetical protein
VLSPRADEETEAQSSKVICKAIQSGIGRLGFRKASARPEQEGCVGRHIAWSASRQEAHRPDSKEWPEDTDWALSLW